MSEMMYKWKDKKLRLVNKLILREVNPNESLNAVEGQKHEKHVPQESQLIAKWLKAMHISEGFLTNTEKQLSIDILFEYKDAIAFDDLEIELLNPVIELSVAIQTVLYEL